MMITVINSQQQQKSENHSKAVTVVQFVKKNLKSIKGININLRKLKLF